MTDPISNERLAEMLAGLEGVTPGPWRMVTDYPSISIGAGDYRVVQTANQNNHQRFGTAERWIGIEHETNATHIARCDPDTIRSLIEEVQASRRQSPAGVEVKPLEWHGPDFEDEYWAARHGEKYVIRAETVNGRWLGGVGGCFPSVEAAKAAAQADYERRILSSLSVKEPEGVPVWFAVQSASGAHIGMWQDELIARRVFEIEYPDGKFIPLYASPPPKAVTIADGEEEQRIEEMRFKAFRTNDPQDRQAYFDAVSKWFQHRHYRYTAALSSEAHNGREGE